MLSYTKIESLALIRESKAIYVVLALNFKHPECKGTCSRLVLSICLN